VVTIISKATAWGQAAAFVRVVSRYQHSRPCYSAPFDCSTRCRVDHDCCSTPFHCGASLRDVYQRHRLMLLHCHSTLLCLQCICSTHIHLVSRPLDCNMSFCTLFHMSISDSTPGHCHSVAHLLNPLCRPSLLLCSLSLRHISAMCLSG
jgi:hypothetical protein